MLLQVEKIDLFTDFSIEFLEDTWSFQMPSCIEVVAPLYAFNIKVIFTVYVYTHTF